MAACCTAVCVYRRGLIWCFVGCSASFLGSDRTGGRRPGVQTDCRVQQSHSRNRQRNRYSVAYSVAYSVICTHQLSSTCQTHLRTFTRQPNRVYDALHTRARAHIHTHAGVIHKFLRDNYGKRFPELEQLVLHPLDYLRTVKARHALSCHATPLLHCCTPAC